MLVSVETDGRKFRGLITLPDRGQSVGPWLDSQDEALADAIQAVEQVKAALGPDASVEYRPVLNDGTVN